FSTDAIADFEGLLGSSARKTVQWTVFSENGSADPGGKSRNLQAADVGKGTARCAAVLCGISLNGLQHKKAARRQLFCWIDRISRPG
ncbi:MAG: hypothetical protein IJH03_06575, partial [Clostridia bacterium]|nr:hypothetical protein [Clostridia bacterium]